MSGKMCIFKMFNVNIIYFSMDFGGELLQLVLQEVYDNYIVSSITLHCTIFKYVLV